MLRKRLTLFGIICLLTFTGYQVVLAAVDLVDFTATALSDSILIEWETATELDNAGFYVKRSTSPSLPYEDISGFIPSEGSGVIGAEYQFTDENADIGVLYFYILESIDNGQNVDTYGPVTAVIGTQVDTATPTASATSTNTNTPNPKNTATRTPTRTSRPSRTPRPSRTATRVPPSRTPTVFTETPTLTPSATITPTATLDAPPIIVLTYPATNTPLPTHTTTPLPTWTPTLEPAGPLTRFVDSSYPFMLGAICLVALVWAAIAVGIFIILQRRNS